MLPSSFVIFVIVSYSLNGFLFSTGFSLYSYPSTPFLQLLTPSTWNRSPAKKVIILPAGSTKLQFSRKRTQVPNNESSTILHQFLDYKLLFIPKTTKGFVNPYLITYNKPLVTPVSQKLGAHFIKKSLSEPILRPTHQRPN